MVTNNGYFDRRVNRTRKSLINAFLELLEEKSYDLITIEDITQLAKYNRATFYLHFYDKEHVLESVIDEKLDHLINSVTPLMTSNIQRNEYFQLGPKTTQFFSYFTEDATFFKTMLLTRKLDYF